MTKRSRSCWTCSLGSAESISSWTRPPTDARPRAPDAMSARSRTTTCAVIGKGTAALRWAQQMTLAIIAALGVAALGVVLWKRRPLPWELDATWGNVREKLGIAPRLERMGGRLLEGEIDGLRIRLETRFPLMLAD